MPRARNSTALGAPRRRKSNTECANYGHKLANLQCSMSNRDAKPKKRGNHVFSNGMAIPQLSAICRLFFCMTASAAFLFTATNTPVSAFPKVSNPTSVPAEEQSDNDKPETENNSEQAQSDIDAYLYRLMMAESAGKPHAKNPRSTALGPYQFINSTFIAVVDRHFSDEVEGMTRSQILALRTDMEFSRRAAIAFNNDNAKYLRERGVTPTFAHLRLTHLLGPAAAVKVLRAKGDTQLTKLLPGPVIRANPFMKRMTVARLVSWAEREVGVVWTTPSEIAKSDETETPEATEVKADDETSIPLPQRKSRVAPLQEASNHTQ